MNFQLFKISIKYNKFEIVYLEKSMIKNIRNFKLPV